MSSALSSERIKAEARSLGFSACGIARAERVEPWYEHTLRHRIAARQFAGMSYMYDHVEMRLDPRLLMPGAQSVVSLALSYAPAERIRGELQIADYALGQDYHDVMKRMMRRLVASLDITTGCRCLVDTAPIAERYWAWRAGLGWPGRNGQLIIPGAGSMFFLGEILLADALDCDTPMPPRCGNCHACIDACPTHALTPAGEDFHAERCLSYQTIENRGPLSPEAAERIGTYIYGCDRCTRACPHNRLATPTTIDDFTPREALLNMRREDWQQMTEDDYRRLFRGSAVKRAKYAGLTRNIRAATAQPSETGKKEKGNPA